MSVAASTVEVVYTWSPHPIPLYSKKETCNITPFFGRKGESYDFYYLVVKVADKTYQVISGIQEKLPIKLYNDWGCTEPSLLSVGKKWSKHPISDSLPLEGMDLPLPS